MQGQLFTQDFLMRGVLQTPPHEELNGAAFAAFKSALQSISSGVDGTSTTNEAQTEAMLINKVLLALGWGDDKANALAETRDDRRCRHGLAILEAKRWLRPLDRGDGKDAFDRDAPSSQMLRYLRRVDVASDRAIKWGMLTTGAVWRLYWALGYKEIPAPMNARSMIAMLLPGVAFGNKVALLIQQAQSPQAGAGMAGLIAANLNSFAFDFVLRQKTARTDHQPVHPRTTPRHHPLSLQRFAACRLRPSHARSQADERPPHPARGGRLCDPAGAGAELYGR
jgi:hypothetical protein